MKKQRQLNIELLRIFSMLLINLWHVRIHFMEALDLEPSISKTVMDYATYFIPFHVDLFILITGYFGVRNSKSALVKNLCLVYFYSISLGFVSLMTSGQFVWQDAFLPISSKTWWFMTMYTVMLLIAPIFEKFINGCSRRTIYAIAIGALFVNLYLGHFHHVSGVYDEGLGVTNFICLYLLGAWIRKEGINLVRKLPWKRSCLAIGILGVMAIQYKAMAWASWMELAAYCGPYCITMSMLVFLLFANFNISESYRKYILFFSSSAISVYLVTEYPKVLEILKPLFATAYLSCKNYMVEMSFILLCIVIAFVIPCLIDKVRITIMKTVTDIIDNVNYNDKVKIE